MKIFLTGATGFVGSTLTRKLTEKGHTLTILTRKVVKDRPLPKGVSYLEGNPTQPGKWQERAAECEAVVNLAGASIFRRWTKKSKKDILESRITTTRNLVDALSSRKRDETLFLSTSAVGYYGFHEDEDLDEESPPGDDFLASVSKDWESAALKAEDYSSRVVLLRFGIVLGREGGALKRMLPLFNWYLGSPLGNGRQWFSWIHEQDLTDIFLYVMEQKDLSGPINCTSPNPVRNRDLTRVLGEVMGKPTFMPAVPAMVMRMIMGEFGSVLLKGQRVLPKKLLDKGFRFVFPEIRGALEDLLNETGNLSANH